MEGKLTATMRQSLQVKEVVFSQSAVVELLERDGFEPTLRVCILRLRVSMLLHIGNSKNWWKVE
jgi:hypothetical protein